MKERFYLYRNGLLDLCSIFLYRAIQHVRTEATRDNNFGSYVRETSIKRMSPCTSQYLSSNTETRGSALKTMTSDEWGRIGAWSRMRTRRFHTEFQAIVHRMRVVHHVSLRESSDFLSSENDWWAKLSKRLTCMLKDSLASGKECIHGTHMLTEKWAHV
jgi:hypothetical protein